jgi:tRNA-dihydrouridine synthase B
MTLDVKPLRIGDLTLGLPLILAPLAGYTDQAYRMLCRSLGAEYCATEMMLDKSLIISQKLRDRLVQPCEGDAPMAGQIIGNGLEDMPAAAIELCKMGLDVIDLNFACPVRKAIGRQRGGHLMRDPELAIAITRNVIAAIDKPVTLKIRRAFYEKDTTYDAMWQILDGAFDAGAAMVCVHTRSVEALYRGKADWEVLAEIKRRYSDKCIVGSGDVLDAQAALDMIQQTGVDAALAARGALGNPWLFRQFADLLAGREPYTPTLPEQAVVMREHFDRAEAVYGPEKAARVMRKFGIRYGHLHPTPKKIRIAFVAVKNPEQWQAVLDEFYSE